MPAARKKPLPQRGEGPVALETPVGFSKGVLGHDLWPLQGEIANAVANNRYVAVKSCNASGKTFLAADIVLWWVTTFPDAIAVTTAPTWMQVEELLWGEIRRSLKSAKIAYPRTGLTKIDLSAAGNTDKNYAIGLSTNDHERFSGFHSGRVLIVLDEAPGVRAEVWQAIQGLRAGGNVRVLAIGNPVEIGGDFYDAFTSRREHWKTYTISAFDTPNLAPFYLDYEEVIQKGEVEEVVVTRAGRGTINLLEASEEQLDLAPRGYLCTPRWVKEMFTEWGADHAFFQSRVLGAFPKQSESTLIPLAWLERNKAKEVPKPITGGKVKAGLDVAGPGEAETVLAVQDENDHLLELSAWPKADPRGDVVARLNAYKGRLARVNVDCVGLGWGIYLHLKDEFGGTIVRPVNVGAEPRDKRKFANAKAEHYWGLRLRAQSGDLTGIKDEKTIGQLTAIRYKHNARGQIEIEKKEELVKRGVKSPDRAEAVMLAQAETDHAVGQLFKPMIIPKSGSDTPDEGYERDSPWRMR